FLCLTLWAANTDRDLRSQAQEPNYSFDATPVFEFAVLNAPFRDDVWTTVLVKGTEDSPAPAGVPRFPRAGEAWISPAVAKAIAEDPQVATRIPGRVVGTIANTGLESPDQFFVHAGTAELPQASPAAGWGAPFPFTDRPRLPRLGLLAILLTMVGLPSILLTMVATRLSSQARRRDLGALHLIGLPRRGLATAAATETAWCVAAGGIAALPVSVAISYTAASRGWFGFTWFNLPAVMPVALIVTAWLLVALWAAVATFRTTKAGLTDVFGAREGGPRKQNVLMLLPLASGIALLCGIVAPALLADRAMSSEMRFYGFLFGTLLAGIGALVAMPTLLRAVATVGHSRSHSLTATLGTRRLWWSSDALSRSTAALMVLVVSAMIGSAVVADLDRLSPQSSQGDLYSVTAAFSSPAEVRKVASVPTHARLLMVGDDQHATTVGTCRDLRTFLSRVHRKDLPLVENCREGQTFPNAEGLNDLPVPPGTFVAQDLRKYDGTWQNAELIVSPGPGVNAIDEYVNRVTAVVPKLEQVRATGVGSQHAIIPTVRQLLVAAMLAGLLISAVTALLALGDGLRASAAQRARLRVIGLSSWQGTRPHVIAMAVATLVCLAVANTVGWLAALGYDVAGGTGATPGMTGVVVSFASVLAAALLVAASILIGRTDRLELTELIHDE
ncbi:MAG TPA: hypothetical protein PLQ19_11685, partial [Aeromicrobium sp.]|nr:hypothetical protein [Aeromicrobium sp.]